MTAGSVTYDQLRDFIAGIYQAAGVAAADAGTVAGLMAQADMVGADGHGVFRLPQYVRRIRAGGMNPRAVPRIVEERPASALIDGDNGLGHLATTKEEENNNRKKGGEGAEAGGLGG